MAVSRMYFKGGSLPAGRRESSGLLRWKGLGFVAPAKMPTYIVEGGLALGFFATIEAKRNLSSASNSTELFNVKMKKFSEPSEQLKTIFTSELA